MWWNHCPVEIKPLSPLCCLDEESAPVSVTVYISFLNVCWKRQNTTAEIPFIHTFPSLLQVSQLDPLETGETYPQHSFVTSPFLSFHSYVGCLEFHCLTAAQTSQTQARCWIRFKGIGDWAELPELDGHYVIFTLLQEKGQLQPLSSHHLCAVAWVTKIQV